MLSVLIPTYNYDITPLVQEIHKQCKTLNLEFEILAYDDHSKPNFIAKNRTLEKFDCFTYKILPKNIGRSAIRNQLGKEAKYDQLLFIDAGTFPEQDNFIKNYISLASKNISTGGMTHHKKAPKKAYKLRWLYTKKREHNSLCSSNFMISKNVFLSHGFDESLTHYGYEDVLFFETLIKNGYKIHSFKNPVIHASDDTAEIFIHKTELAVENLVYLFNQKKLNPNKNRLHQMYSKLARFKLDLLICIIFKFTKPFLLFNFNSSYPSILLFDFYRLGYLCCLKNN